MSLLSGHSRDIPKYNILFKKRASTTIARRIEYHKSWIFFPISSFDNLIICCAFVPDS